MFRKKREKERQGNDTAPTPPPREEFTDGGDGAGEQQDKTLNMPALVLKAGSSSERGEHERNEDCCVVDWQEDFYAVSDGIGGAPDGDYMSRVSCGAALENYRKTHDVKAAFKMGNECAVRVSRWICNDDCGATLLVAAQDGNELRFAWAGDSALYRLRDGALLRLTSEERQDGTNMLTSAIGYDEHLEPSCARSSVKPGDVFLMCSDGVWSVYKEQDLMGELIRKLSSASKGASPISVARDVVFSARLRGYDDATAIVLAAADEKERSETGYPDGIPPTPVIPTGDGNPKGKAARTPRWTIRERGGVR